LASYAFRKAESISAGFTRQTLGTRMKEGKACGVLPNVRAKVAPTVWRAGTAAQNWGEAPAPQAQCATPLGLSLSEGLGFTRDSFG
jgi:hypothetical protein